MAKTVTILAAGTAATAGDKTAVSVGGKTPFLPNRKARAIFDAVGQTGTAPVYQLDGSDDNSTWTADVCDSNVVLGAGVTAVECTCYKYMRATVTTAAGTTAGTLGVHLEGLD
jgi:Zn-dependent M28 family amino/carboxypeptidase